ncbi:MAG: insulinase family protein, partial [Clostridiales bacterium]|nr:insulinase family protein [Clostridiales bacterium]
LRPAVYHPAMTLKKKATEQNHLLLSFPSIQADSPQRFTMQLLSSILGGGMSSRLFQEIREQRGLCYSIYAAGSCYADTGMFLLYTALNRDTEAQALTAIREVVRRFTEDGVTQEELDRAREQAKASVLMGLEANTAHMNHLARNILNGTPIQTAEEIIASYDAITRQDVQDMARETFDWSQLGFSAVGRVAGEEQYRELLKM